MAMMEALFKAKEGERDQQIKKLRAEVGQHKQNLLKFDQQRFVSEELEADSYQRLKAHTLERIERLNIQIADLEIIRVPVKSWSYGKEPALNLSQAKPVPKQLNLNKLSDAGGLKGSGWTTQPGDQLLTGTRITDTAFQKYTRYGMSLLKDLTW